MKIRFSVPFTFLLAAILVFCTACGNSSAPGSENPAKDSSTSKATPPAGEDAPVTEVEIPRTPENCPQVVKDYETAVIEYISFSLSFEKSMGNMDAATGNELKSKCESI